MTIPNVFLDKGDIAIRIALTFMIFGEVFIGVLLIDYYKLHKVWFERISKQIKGMPPIWMIQVMWAIVYFMLGSSLFIFYRNSMDILNTNYVLDMITFLVVINLALNKMYPFVFLKIRRTSIALVMMVFIIASSVAIAIIFAIHEKWTEFGTILIYPIWCTYLFYINLAWIRIEHRRNG